MLDAVQCLIEHDEGGTVIASCDEHSYPMSSPNLWPSLTRTVCCIYANTIVRNDVLNCELCTFTSTRTCSLGLQLTRRWLSRDSQRRARHRTPTTATHAYAIYRGLTSGPGFSFSEAHRSLQRIAFRLRWDSILLHKLNYCEYGWKPMEEQSMQWMYPMQCTNVVELKFWRLKIRVKFYFNL